MRRIVDYIASVQFFVIVSVLLAICVAVASTIPQGLAPSAYERSIDPAVLSVLRLFAFTNFFASPLFFLLVGLMELSLLLCAVPRFVARYKKRPGESASTVAKRRRTGIYTFAADIIHLGLLVLIAAGLMTTAVRERWELTGFVGDEFELPNGTIGVTDAGKRLTKRGALAGWYLEVELRGDAISTGSRTVTFGSNSPVRSALGRLHFRNYHQIARAVLVDTSAPQSRDELVLTEGEGLLGSNGGAMVLVGSSDGTAVFADLDSVPEAEEDIARVVDRADRVKLAPGEGLGSLELIESNQVIVVGFTVTHNPARIPILAGLAIITAGMVLYLIKRLNKVD